MKHFLMIAGFIGLLFNSLNLMAQSTTINGTVMDDAREGLPGVNILVKGTTTGTVTNVDGTYSISVLSSADTLAFSSIGYGSEEIAINNRTTIDLTMMPDVKSLQEVVVVGYGTQQKSDVTSSIATVDAEELEALPVTGVEQALQGRAAGVTVTSNNGLPGSGVTVRIRGIGTVNNNDPLYVVDGVPVSGMNYLNPSDIASLEILKDASAAAIYGSRAANGVVLITTKKGVTGENVVALDAYYGLSRPWKDYDPAGREEYLTMVKSVNGESSKEYQKALEEGSRDYSTNWWKETVRTAPVQNYNLAIRGGTNKVHYNFSGGYFNQQGAIKPSAFKRLSARINTDYQLSDRIKFGENLSVSNEVRQNTVPDILGPIQKYDPLVPVIDPELDQTNPFNKWGDSQITFGSNPLGLLARQIGDQSTLRMVGNVYGNLNILDNLVFTSNFGFDVQRGSSNSFGPIYYNDASDNKDQASASAGSNTSNGWVWFNTLNWDQTFGDHKLNVLIGTQAERNESYWVNGTRYGQPGNDPKFQYIDAGTTGDIIYGSANESSLDSYFGRLSYSFLSKYLFSASIRRDGSSNFSEGNRWGTFPAFSAGWVISQEDFWQDLDISWVSYFKLRGGWGQLGNQSIPGGAFTSFISGGNTRRYVFGQDNVVQGYAISNTGNSKIRWETSEQSNIGFELGLFNDALVLEGEYYDRKTRDMLIAYPVASTFGASSPWVNAGSVQNRGLELTVDYRGNVGELKYSVGGNISHYKNKVLSLGEGQPYVESIPQARVSGTSRTAENRPISEFYGWKTDGIFQSQAEVNAYTNKEGALVQPNARPGDFRFVDVSGDGNISDDDKTDIGSPHPDFTYGLNFNLQYKAFDLTVFLQGSQGNKLFNINKYSTHQPLGFDNVEAGVVYNAWTPGNGSNTQPVMTISDPNNNYRASDWYVEDGSYFRFKNVQLGYNLPPSVLSAVGMTQCRIYIAAQNLFTFTPYSGLDPELGVISQNLQGSGNAGTRQRLMGVDSYNFPQSRTFQLGVSVKF